MENSHDLFDKYLDRILQRMELQLKMNSIKQSLNPNPPKCFSQLTPQSYNSFISKTVHMRAEGVSEHQGEISRNYDGVSGFRAGICQNCLATMVMEIGASRQNLGIQNVQHKCDPSRADAIKKLDSVQYSTDLLTKVNKLPEMLFQKC